MECAAVCNHCASSCTKEENIKMMATCIELVCMRFDLLYCCPIDEPGKCTLGSPIDQLFWFRAMEHRSKIYG